MTLHLTTFEGEPNGASSINAPVSALSGFRAQQLLLPLQAIDGKICSISARFVHLVATELPPSPVEKARLAALLTYGEPCAPDTAADALVLIVSPRLGTVSPWASKATDIARNCGLAVKRIERITEYSVVLKSGLFSKAALTENQQIGRAHV